MTDIDEIGAFGYAGALIVYALSSSGADYRYTIVDRDFAFGGHARTPSHGFDRI